MDIIENMRTLRFSEVSLRDRTGLLEIQATRFRLLEYGLELWVFFGLQPEAI